MESYLFPAVDMGVMASSVTAAIVLSPIVLQVETKMAPTTTTMAMTNKMHHSVPSTLPSNPCLRENKGKGDKGKDGGHCHGRQW
jgi:hypothetical protein